MTTSDTTKTASPSPARDLLDAARRYFGGRRALVILAIAALIGGIALNWSWLVAAGIAPLLLTVLPCLVMCGLGLCMNKLIGRSCASEATQSRTSEPIEPKATTDIAYTTGPSIRQPALQRGESQ
jgi:hypothetical protein